MRNRRKIDVSNAPFAVRHAHRMVAAYAAAMQGDLARLDGAWETSNAAFAAAKSAVADAARAIEAFLYSGDNYPNWHSSRERRERAERIADAIMWPSESWVEQDAENIGIRVTYGPPEWP